MLSRILVAGIVAGGLSGSTLFGQTTPVPFDWASIVGGAIGSSPAALILAWQLQKGEKREAAKDMVIQEKDKVIERLHADDRQHAERIATVLADASRALSGAQEGMEAILDRDRPVADIERVVRRLEGIVREAEDRDHRGGSR